VALPYPPFEKVSTVRLRRSASLVVSAAVVATLAACGSTTKVGYGDPTAEGFSAVSISGDVGKAPTVKWHEEMAYPKTTTVKTLVKGTGAPVANGDSVSTYIWIGDGTTKLEAYSDFSNGSPETLTNDGKMGPVWNAPVAAHADGDRIAAVTGSADLLGAAGNPQMGIGTHDSLVVIVDLIKKTKPEPSTSPSASPTTPALSGPKGTAQPAHIHEGTCSKLDPKPKWGLENVVDGKSTTEVPVGLAEIQKGTYAINVHKSGEDLKTYVACGNIAKSGGGKKSSSKMEK